MPGLEQIAQALARARVSRTRASLPLEEAAKLSLNDGYALMQKTGRILEQEHGWKVKGFKVGATSKAVQQRMGLGGPFWGAIYDKAEMTAPPNRNGNIPRFSIKEDLIRGVEAEFAFRISKDITPRPNKKYTAEELMTEHCSTVIPCVEVCGFRLTPELGNLAPLIIADTGNTAVIFPNHDMFSRKAADVYKDLAGSRASVLIDGETVANGSGADVWGSPELALEWFVQEACNGPAQLTIPQGTFVTTGATCGLVPITKSSYVHASFAGVSKCDVHIAFRA